MADTLFEIYPVLHEQKGGSFFMLVLELTLQDMQLSAEMIHAMHYGEHKSQYL